MGTGRGDNSGMLKAFRYCKRCQTQTEHTRARRPFPWGWRQFLAYPFELIADLRHNRWECIACRRHDRQGKSRRRP